MLRRPVVSWRSRAKISGRWQLVRYGSQIVATSRHSPGNWIGLTDEQLLDRRPCDLGLRLKNSRPEPAVEQLYCELASRSIRFRPHVWLSDEWFTPDGIPGIAVPFYLAHPRLANSSSGRCSKSKAVRLTGACDSAS